MNESSQKKFQGRSNDIFRYYSHSILNVFALKWFVGFNVRTDNLGRKI